MLTLVCYVLHLILIGLKELQTKNYTMTYQRLQKKNAIVGQNFQDTWRHDEEFMHNLLFWMPTNEKNKRGRPQKLYIDQLIEDTGLQMEELKNLMADKEEWKSFISSNFPSEWFDQWVWVSEWYSEMMSKIYYYYHYYILLW